MPPGRVAKSLPKIEAKEANGLVGRIIGRMKSIYFLCFFGIGGLILIQVIPELATW